MKTWILTGILILAGVLGIYNVAQAASASGTVIYPGSGAQIVDSSGNVWVLVSETEMTENGKATTTGDISYMLYYNNNIYTYATNNTWWEWTGSYLKEVSGDPRSATTTAPTATTAPIIITQPLSQTVTLGQTATFTVVPTVPSGTVSSYTYWWYMNGVYISGANTNTYTTPATTSAYNGADFVVVVSNSAGSVHSNTAVLTVKAAATPVSCVGSWGSCSATCGGGTQTYAITTAALSGGTACPYANGATESCNTQACAPAAPSIVTQPSSQTVTLGQTATFTVIPSGTASSYTYLWYMNGVYISGANTNTYTTPATTSAYNGADFSVVIYNSSGSVTSNAAVLTVKAAASPINCAGSWGSCSATCGGGTQIYTVTTYAANGGTACPYASGATESCNTQACPPVVVVPTAPAIAIQPSSQTVSLGQTATFTVVPAVVASNTGSPFTYLWYMNGVYISGANTNTYTTPTTTSAYNGADFAVVISNSAGSVTSSTAVLTVNSAATTVTCTGGYTCAGVSVSLSAGQSFCGASPNQDTYTCTSSGTWQQGAGCTCVGNGVGGSTASAVNGACGSANGVSVASAPSSNLCSTGSASSVSGSGPFSWSCAGSNGGSTASCSAPKATSTVSASGTTITVGSGKIVDSSGNVWTLVSQTQLDENSTAITIGNSSMLLYYNSTVYLEATNNTWWQWTGSYLTQVSGDPRGTASPVSGGCGSANGAESLNAPTASLCSTGTASSVTGNGTTWNWSCAGNGGSTAICSAPVQPSATNGACGSANGMGVSTIPSTNLCSSGVASALSGNGPWSWSCEGTSSGTTVSCSAPIAISGTCGTSNGASLMSAPAANLCNSGNASTVSGTGPWTWSCLGVNNGTTAGCSASMASSSSITPPAQANGYNLVWSENFSNFKVCMSSCTGSGGNGYNWFEPGMYWESPVSPVSNISVNNNILNLNWSVGQAPSGDTSIATAVTGHTQNAWHYGYFEASFAWDNVTGAWPAFWLIPVDQFNYSATTYYGEFDIFEGQGGAGGFQANQYGGHFHTWLNGVDTLNNNATGWVNMGNVNWNQFHTYGMLWTPGQLTWYLDNRLVGTATIPASIDSETYEIILTGGEGSQAWSYGNTSGVTATSIPMNVQWVHVYQK